MSKNDEEHLIRLFRGENLGSHQNSKLLEQLVGGPAKLAGEVVKEDCATGSIIDETRRLASNLANSRLFPIEFCRGFDNERLLVLDKSSQADGLVTIWRHERGNTVPLTFSRGEEFGQIVVSVPELPAAVRPICVVLTRLGHHPRQPAIGSVALGIGQEMQPLGLVADDFINAEDEEGLFEQELVTGKSPDLDWELEVDTLFVRVWGDLPVGREMDTVIADLRLSNEMRQERRQVRPLSLRARTGARYMGNTGFDWPDLGGRVEGELTVRSLEDGDMHLLAPRQAIGCLATATCHFAFPLQELGGNWVFEMGELDRQAAIKETGASWFLQAVVDD